MEIPIRLDDVKNLGWEIDFSDHHQFAVIDEKDDPPIGKLKRPRLVCVNSLSSLFNAKLILFVIGACRSKTNEDVAESVYNSAKHGNMTLTLGGDHSLVGGNWPHVIGRM